MQQRILFRSRFLVVFGSLAVLSLPTCACGAVVAYLDGARAVGVDAFETDLIMAAQPDRIGDEIELINLDIVNSSVKGVPLNDFTRVRFTSAPDFAPWQDGQQFGMTVGFESQIVLDAFSGVGAVPFPLSDTNPFRVGTLRFDFGGLGLSEGDSVALNIVGVPDGSPTRTTSVAVRDNPGGGTQLFNPDFSTPAGSGEVSFTITAIPEPMFAPLGVAISAVILSRRRRT